MKGRGSGAGGAGGRRVATAAFLLVCSALLSALAAAPGAAAAHLHHATSALRRALESDLPDKFPSRYIEVEEGWIALRLPPGSIADCIEFERRVRQGQWEAAVALYTGDLLPAARYAEWAAAPRERLIQMHLRALVALAGERLAAGRALEALDACQRALSIDPWQEQAVLIGMRACQAMGDRTTALRLYRDLEQSLRQELQTEPLRELQNLYRALIGPRRRKTPGQAP